MDKIQIYTIVAPADRDAAKLIEETIGAKFPELHFIPICTDEPLSKTWSLRVADRIRQADLVICLIGENSYLYSSINWEITFSLSLHKPLHSMSLANQENCFVPPFVLIDKNLRPHKFDLKELCRRIFSSVPTKIQKKTAA